MGEFSTDLVKAKKVFISKIVTLVIVSIVGLGFLNPWYEHNLEPVVFHFFNIAMENDAHVASLPIVIGIDQFYDESVQRGANPAQGADPALMKEMLDELRLAIKAGNEPVAYGFDIDYSYQANMKEDTNQGDFIKELVQFQEDIRKTDNIFIGVGRRAITSQGDWLPIQENGASLNSMAASIAQVCEDPFQAISISHPNGKGKYDSTINSMATRLGDAYLKFNDEKKSAHQSVLTSLWKQEGIKKYNDVALRVDKFLVDYSVLDKVTTIDLRRAKPHFPPEKLALLKDKVLLIGLTHSLPSDIVSKSEYGLGNEDSLRRGIYMHACGFYSYAIRPVVRLPHVVGLFFEIVFAVIAMLVSFAARLHFSSEPFASSRFICKAVRIGTAISLISWLLCCVGILAITVYTWQRSSIFFRVILVVGFFILSYQWGCFIRSIRAAKVEGVRAESEDEGNEEMVESVFGMTKLCLIASVIGMTYALLLLDPRILFVNCISAIIYLLSEPILESIIHPMSTLFARMKGKEKV